jgi:hypothetical protein
VIVSSEKIMITSGFAARTTELGKLVHDSSIAESFELQERSGSEPERVSV